MVIVALLMIPGAEATECQQVAMSNPEIELLFYRSKPFCRRQFVVAEAVGATVGIGADLWVITLLVFYHQQY